MIERGEHLRLALEAREPIGVGGKDRGQDFQRDVATKPGVAGTVDFAHPAGADRHQDFVAPQFRSRRQHRGLMPGSHQKGVSYDRRIRVWLSEHAA